MRRRVRPVRPDSSPGFRPEGSVRPAQAGGLGSGWPPTTGPDKGVTPVTQAFGLGWSNRPFRLELAIHAMRYHFRVYLRKKSQIRSLADTFIADLPISAIGGFWPGQVWPPPSITTSTTSEPSLPPP